MHASPALTYLAALVAIAIPAATQSQEPFEGWMRLHSDSTHESYVAPASWSESEGDSDSVRVVRLISNRMLVRRIEEGRAAEIAARQRLGLTSDGYERYAATTRVLEIRCHTKLVSVWEVTDRNSSGDILDRRILERRWQVPESLDDAGATAAIVGWACRSRSRPPGG